MRHESFSSSIPDGTILGVEEQLRGQVVDGCPDLLAKLDLIFDAGDALTVIDLKTAASRWNERRHRTRASSCCCTENWPHTGPRQPLRLEFLVMTKTKTPAIDRFPVEENAGFGLDRDEERHGRIRYRLSTLNGQPGLGSCAHELFCSHLHEATAGCAPDACPELFCLDRAARQFAPEPSSGSQTVSSCDWKNLQRRVAGRTVGWRWNIASAFGGSFTAGQFSAAHWGFSAVFRAGGNLAFE